VNISRGGVIIACYSLRLKNVHGSVSDKAVAPPPRAYVKKNAHGYVPRRQVLEKKLPNLAGVGFS